MLQAYPVIMTHTDDGVLVTLPDFNRNTQGKDMADAIYMARDAIGLLGMDMLEDGNTPPEPGTVPYELKEGDILTYVDVDIEGYKNKLYNRSVKKNCTIPYWLSVEADKRAVNYSKVLQNALEELVKVS
jgi:predicted RNase H-like HicB family nuclease